MHPSLPHNSALFPLLTPTPLPPSPHLPLSFPSFLPQPLSKLVPSAGPEALDLLTALCAWDPARRPTAMMALQHPYFQVGVGLPERSAFKGRGLCMQKEGTLCLWRERALTLQSCTAPAIQDAHRPDAHWACLPLQVGIKPPLPLLPAAPSERANGATTTTAVVVAASSSGGSNGAALSLQSGSRRATEEQRATDQAAAASSRAVVPVVIAPRGPQGLLAQSNGQLQGRVSQTDASRRSSRDAASLQLGQEVSCSSGGSGFSSGMQYAGGLNGRREAAAAAAPASRTNSDAGACRVPAALVTPWATSMDVAKPPQRQPLLQSPQQLLPSYGLLGQAGDTGPSYKSLSGGGMGWLQGQAAPGMRAPAAAPAPQQGARLAAAAGSGSGLSYGAGAPCLNGNAYNGYAAGGGAAAGPLRNGVAGGQAPPAGHAAGMGPSSERQAAAHVSLTLCGLPGACAERRAGGVHGFALYIGHCAVSGAASTLRMLGQGGHYCFDEQLQGRRMGWCMCVRMHSACGTLPPAPVRPQPRCMVAYPTSHPAAREYSPSAHSWPHPALPPPPGRFTCRLHAQHPRAAWSLHACAANGAQGAATPRRWRWPLDGHKQHSCCSWPATGQPNAGRGQQLGARQAQPAAIRAAAAAVCCGAAGPLGCAGGGPLCQERLPVRAECAACIGRMG